MLEKEVGKRIRELREKQQMTREEFAYKVEITSKFLYEVENGKKGMSVGTLCKIAEALSTSCDYILLGVYKMDEENKLGKNFRDFLRSYNEVQRNNVIKILEEILEMKYKCQ